MNLDSSREPGFHVRNILAPVDFSAASLRGIAFAAAVAARFQSRLHFIHVIDPTTGCLPVQSTFEMAKLEHAAKERLHGLQLQCGIDPALIGSANIRIGRPKIEICSHAAEQHTDLIVIASHGVGGFKHTLIGSTSEAVVRHAHCPVLTIREHICATQVTERPHFVPSRILATTVSWTHRLEEVYTWQRDGEGHASRLLPGTGRPCARLGRSRSPLA